MKRKKSTCFWPLPKDCLEANKSFLEISVFFDMACQKKFAFQIVMQPRYVSCSKLAALHEYSSGLSLRVDLRILNTRGESGGTKLK